MAKDNLDMNLKNFQFSIDDHGVATALMDVEGEKLNTLSRALFEDIIRILERVENDTTIKALVVGSAKKDSFVVGADIKMLKGMTSAADATRMVREGQQVLARLEALHEEWGKPVVAAIHGQALGGGLELALACSMRICTDYNKTMFGFPEVQIGLFPGAGGTQRTPRLIGVANALDMILTARNVRPKKAKKLGLVDEVVPESILLDVARQRAWEATLVREQPKTGIARIRELAGDLTDAAHLQQLALEENPVGLRVLFKKAREALLEKTRGNYPGPEKALEVVRIGIQEGIDAGYAAEADRFGQLVVSPQARALMSIFFATQDLKKDKGVDNPDVEVRDVTKVGILGGGLMGAGIAQITATKAKLPVRIKEIDSDGICRALSYVQKNLDKDRKRKRRTWQDVEQVMSLITAGTEMDGLGDRPLIIEAVFEDLALKHRVLQEVEATTPDDTIFASNTSALPITKIAEGSKHPETVIGMHYFSPVEKMPLLEIITTDKTADWVTATCVEVGKKQGKTVIVVNDGPGFYTSRILVPYTLEAFWLLSEGAAIEEIDNAVMNWGFPVGPVVLSDEVGIDVGAKVAKFMRAEFGERMEAPGNVDSLIKDGRMGRKNGRGFYRYVDGEKKGPDPSVYALFGQDEKRKPFAEADIQKRVGLAFVNEAARCLEEGILRSPRDGDIGAIFGLGFPPFRGGPFSYIDHVGASEICRRLDQLAERHGMRFTPAEIIREYAKAGKKFR
jgi:3-hydroxyacyl-CoA dehydrogenase/enoyl-CoA hydratase/3-hydroxybutyryl-CoA epimerase